MPEYREVHEDKIMTGMTLGYETQEYVADQVLPILGPGQGVNERSGKYFVFGPEQFRMISSLRAPGTRSKRIDYAMSKDDFYAQQYLREGAIDDIERKETDPPLSRERDLIAVLTEQHLLEKEVRVANFLINGGGITHTSAFGGSDLGAEWNDHTNATPIDDAKYVKGIMRAAGGRTPNTVVMSQEVFDELQMCAQIIDSLPMTTERFRATPEQVARALQIDRVVVARAQYNTAAEDVAATLTLGPVWGDTVVFAYINQNPGMRSRSLGYQYGWIPRRGCAPYRSPETNSDIFGIEECVGEKICAPDCGFLATDAIQVGG